MVLDTSDVGADAEAAFCAVREILARPSTTVFSQEVEDRIRAHYTDLISANVEVPEGLQPVS